jgi:hypothetical protein
LTYLVSIDPGESTGITSWGYSEAEPATRIYAAQITGGLQGFLDFFRYENFFFDFDFPDVIVSEQFTLLNHDYVANVEPVRIEGAMVALRMNPVWQPPAVMYFCGGATKAARKKASQDFLKKNDLWLTGKDVGQPDANDAISSTLHALAYFRSIRHMPTLKKYWSEQ